MTSETNKISMKVSFDKSATCEQCGCTYAYTKEMYALDLFHHTHHICYDCMDKLFHVALFSIIEYDGKLKMKDDVLRSERSRTIAEQSEGHNE